MAERMILETVKDEIFNSIKWVYSDLKNLRSLQNIFKENQFDGVFHLAAQSHPPTSFTDPLGTMETNVMGSANLIQCVSDLQPNCKLMFCSTSEVYGNIGMDGKKIKTNDTILPSNPYGSSKAATDLYMQERIVNKKLMVLSLELSLTLDLEGEKFFNIFRCISGCKNDEKSSR